MSGTQRTDAVTRTCVVLQTPCSVVLAWLEQAPTFPLQRVMTDAGGWIPVLVVLVWEAGVKLPPCTFHRSHP